MVLMWNIGLGRHLCLLGRKFGHSLHIYYCKKMEPVHFDTPHLRLKRYLTQLKQVQCAIKGMEFLDKEIGFTTKLQRLRAMEKHFLDKIKVAREVMGLLDKGVLAAPDSLTVLNIILPLTFL